MSGILEQLSEEEAYLYAILTDPSGVDQCELTVLEPENEDGCFRCWPFQWRWWRDGSSHQIDQCARSIGKSKSIQARAYAFPFVHPGEEMVITAPEGVHLDAVTDNIETILIDNRLTREMIRRDRGGIKHRPFMVNFVNGSRIMGRIPQRDGKGVKGIHPIWLELDEGQDFPDAGWIELMETLKAGEPGAVWRAHGVTRGVRDMFYKFTQPDSGWTVHQYTAIHRPSWTDLERQTKIESYGSRDNPDYRRNVLGLHGDATNPLFVLSRLMKCVDTDEGSDYNLNEYVEMHVNAEMLADYDNNIAAVLDVPLSHTRYKAVWMGADIGFTNDPTEILVFSEEPAPPPRNSVLRLIARFQMRRIGAPEQADAVTHLLGLYKPKRFSMDKTGNGLPLFQIIQAMSEEDKNMARALQVIHGYNFSEKILAAIDDSIELDPYLDDPVEKAGVFRKVLEHSTDVLRELVDTQRLYMPFDKEIIAEFQGQTFVYDKSKMDMYGRARRFSQGSFHTLDAARMAALGWSQYQLEQFLAHRNEQNAFRPTTVILL